MTTADTIDIATGAGGCVADALDGEWDRMLSINIRGLLYVTRAATPLLMTAAPESVRASLTS